MVYGNKLLCKIEADCHEEYLYSPWEAAEFLRIDYEMLEHYCNAGFAERWVLSHSFTSELLWSKHLKNNTLH